MCACVYVCVCALSRVCLVHKCNAENAGYFWKGSWYVSDWYIFVCVCVGGRGSEWLEKKWGMIFMWQLICFWMQEAQRPLSKGIKHRARGASVTVLSADTHTHTEQRGRKRERHTTCSVLWSAPLWASFERKWLLFFAKEKTRAGWLVTQQMKFRW